jgi:hypothetical protein
MGVLHSWAAFAGIWGGVVAGSYLLARTIYGRMARGRGEALQTLMSRLVEHASATAVRTPGLARPADEPRTLDGGGKALDR